VNQKPLALARANPLVASIVAISLAHLAFALVLGRSPAGSLASNLLQVGASFIAAVLCVRASKRSEDRARKVWVLAASAFTIWTVAQITYAYHENWLGTFVPQPSWTHFLFRAYGAPWVMALLIVDEEKKGRGPDWLQSLDFAQVGILVLFFYFDLYFVPGRDGMALSGLELGGFFDVSDFENWGLFAAFAVRARLSRHPDERQVFRHLVPYLLTYAVSSTIANYFGAFWFPRAGTLPDVPFTLSLAVACFLAADWKPDPMTPSLASPSPPAVHWIPAVLPLIALALALPVARHAPGVAFVAVFGSVACFGGRLMITLYRRQHLLEELRVSEARYANLVHMAPDAIFVHVGGRIVFANPATARILGVPDPAEIVGRHMADFAPPEFREEVFRALSHLGPGREAGRWVSMRSDGTRVPLDVVGMALPAGSGRSGPPARLVLARDVTHLEQAAAEREALISNLEAKNAELERFTYTVSHDLRSPLITVTGFLAHIEEAAARGDLDALRADLDRIRRATRKMDQLLQDLLELSRVGHVLGSIAPLSFEHLCRDAVEIVGGRLREKGVRVEIEPGLPVVMGDRARLIEVVQNLVDNAAKFMGDEREPVIRIGRRGSAADTVLFVQDNGMGIDTRHHGAIFGLFNKLDQNADGTGVGLALVKRIVDLHGGRIWVESQGLGSGTTFCFTLPLAEEADLREGATEP